MPQEFSRQRRVADLIQRELAVLIQRSVKDPRVGMVTVTAVSVSKEFENAKVYYTVLGNSDNVADTQKGLERAAGYLRKELGRHLKLRAIPNLKFVYDQSLLEGERLSRLIDQAVDADDH